MIELAGGRKLIKGFHGDPSWIDFSHRTIAQIDEEFVTRVRRRVPLWVPAHLTGVYAEIARALGEEEAASHVRALKREPESRP